MSREQPARLKDGYRYVQAAADDLQAQSWGNGQQTEPLANYALLGVIDELLGVSVEKGAPHAR